MCFLLDYQTIKIKFHDNPHLCVNHFIIYGNRFYLIMCPRISHFVQHTLHCLYISILCTVCLAFGNDKHHRQWKIYHGDGLSRSVVSSILVVEYNWVVNAFHVYETPQLVAVDVTLLSIGVFRLFWSWCED